MKDSAEKAEWDWSGRRVQGDLFPGSDSCHSSRKDTTQDEAARDNYEVAKMPFSEVSQLLEDEAQFSQIRKHGIFFCSLVELPG